MNDKEYIKTYKSFILWLAGFPIMGIILPNSLNVSVKISALIILLIIVIFLYILMFIIYKREYVYWINGGLVVKILEQKIQSKKEYIAGESQLDYN